MLDEVLKLDPKLVELIRIKARSLADEYVKKHDMSHIVYNTPDNIATVKHANDSGSRTATAEAENRIISVLTNLHETDKCDEKLISDLYKYKKSVLDCMGIDYKHFSETHRLFHLEIMWFPSDLVELADKMYKRPEEFLKRVDLALKTFINVTREAAYIEYVTNLLRRAIAHNKTKEKIIKENEILNIMNEDTPEEFDFHTLKGRQEFKDFINHYHTYGTYLVNYLENSGIQGTLRETKVINAKEYEITKWLTIIKEKNTNSIIFVVDEESVSFCKTICKEGDFFMFECGDASLAVFGDSFDISCAIDKDLELDVEAEFTINYEKNRPLADAKLLADFHVVLEYLEDYMNKVMNNMDFETKYATLVLTKKI